MVGQAFLPVPTIDDRQECLSYLQTARCAIRLGGPFLEEIIEPLSRTALVFGEGEFLDPMKLTQATSDEEVQQARQLFEEYAAWLGLNLCFQNFDKELAELPGEYAPPSGRLFLANENDQTAGCVALRKIGDGIGEMKRLYVRPEFRGQGLGRTLTETLLREAREIGYRRVRLDTLPGKMDQAIAMYRSLGFKSIDPYYNNPVEGAAFMELEL